jgi:predicted Zn-dependent protease
MTEISKTQGGHPRVVRPMRTVHSVKPGENLADVAAMYGISQADLIKANSNALGAAGVVHPGMRLEIS